MDLNDEQVQALVAFGCQRSDHVDMDELTVGDEVLDTVPAIRAMAREVLSGRVKRCDLCRHASRLDAEAETLWYCKRLVAVPSGYHVKVHADSYCADFSAQILA